MNNVATFTILWMTPFWWVSSLLKRVVVTIVDGVCAAGEASLWCSSVSFYSRHSGISGFQTFACCGFSISTIFMCMHCYCLLAGYYRITTSKYWVFFAACFLVYSLFLSIIENFIDFVRCRCVVFECCFDWFEDRFLFTSSSVQCLC
jgi:hypothetical protein